MADNGAVLLLCVQDGIIAAKRIDMSKKGVDTCGDVDEVRATGLPGCCCLAHCVLALVEPAVHTEVSGRCMRREARALCACATCQNSTWTDTSTLCCCVIRAGVCH